MHHDVTLTVPGTYAADFRAAAAVELAEEAGYASRNGRRFGRHAGTPTSERLRRGRRTLRTSSGCSPRTRRSSSRRAPGTDDITIQLTDRYGCLAHVCETVARRIVGPELVSNVECGPIDRKLADKISEQLAELTWAVDAAAAIHAHHFPDENDQEEVA